MKSLIIEKNKMGLEEEPELLVKGESHNKDSTNITLVFLCPSASTCCCVQFW